MKAGVRLQGDVLRYVEHARNDDPTIHPAINETFESLVHHVRLYQYGRQAFEADYIHRMHKMASQEINLR